jgi:antagonist of KipI
MHSNPPVFESRLSAMKTSEPVHIMVVKPGWLTTVQDLGRYGYQQYGMPVSGAMDRYSYVLANRLTGNQDHAAALEITLKGPELLFEHDSVIAVTGADLSPSVDGIGIPLWTSVPVKAGSRMTFGTRRVGARSYLAITGGFDVPIVLGSRSTHIASQTGGMKGRTLAQGDVLIGGTPSLHQHATIERSLPEKLRPIYSTVTTLRILPGPQGNAFLEQALAILTTNPYRLTSQSDRMGYRLEGPKLGRRRAEQYISDGTAMGVLQVPPDEQPILLMADRQTTGGYPKLAIVISADLHLVGQLLPGDTIQFTTTTLQEAQAALKTQWDALQQALPPFSATAP